MVDLELLRRTALGTRPVDLEPVFPALPHPVPLPLAFLFDVRERHRAETTPGP